ncbi:MAG: ferritin-like domain-containing protein [Planctomycetota bacterium]|nr:MAG: ferritin-like domain-containing protein [Planctomycetota bacterium]
MVAGGMRERWQALKPETRQRLRETLYHDMVSEYDARFLAAYLDDLPVTFSQGFRQVLKAWAEDEEAHFQTLHRINQGLFGVSDRDLERRKPNFKPLETLFEDEFSIACLGAYDEWVTVRGYRNNLPLYNHLGAEMRAVLRRLMADEARHYAGFLAVALECREGEARTRQVVARIRQAESGLYHQTFVLDHDDPIYGPELFDQGAANLCRQLISS